MTTHTSEIQNTCDEKQITFDLDKKSIWYWRRALLIRYFIDLGKNELVHINWSDYDKSSKVLLLKDEDVPFEEKSPSTSLHKSVVQITHKSNKLLTITIYYSTKKCLVQGNSCQNWVEREFDKIKKCVEMCLKGNNPKVNIDNCIRRLNVARVPTLNESGTINDSQSETIPKILDGSLNDSNATDVRTENTADILDTETSACTKTIKGDLEQTNVNKNMKEVVEKSKVTQDIYDAFHSLENKLIACRAENNKKIERLNSVIVDMQNMFATQEANRLES